MRPATRADEAAAPARPAPAGGPPLPRLGPVLAIDPGDRRLGLAVADPSQTFALPLPPLTRDPAGTELDALRRLAGEQEIVGLVVGLPLLPSGAEGAQAAKARRFGGRVAAALGLPVAYVDERHSSALAGRTLVESGRPGRRNRRRYLDSLAAVTILEDFLAARRGP